MNHGDHGAYRLLAKLGQGAMGEIYRALHRPTGRVVALKVIASATSSEARRRREEAIHREVATVARMNHQRVVEIYDFGSHQGSPYLAMELAESSLDVTTISSWDQARSVLYQVLDGLAHAHARGVLHRDLKPDNILVRRPGDLCLTDFGIAYAVPRQESGEDLSEKRSASLTGTPHYMAPEQARNQWRDWGAWTDLYALGCIAFELVCGVPPFRGKTVFAVLEQQLDHPMPPLRPRFAVPQGLEQWIERLLRKQPFERFLRAAVAANRLAQLPEVGGEQSRPTSTAWDAPPQMETLDLSELQTQTYELAAIEPAAESTTWSGPRRWRGQELPDWRKGSTPGRGASAHLLSLHSLREIPLKGRARERDIIWEQLRQAMTHQQARVVVLRGPTGCGTSAVGYWVAERAHELGIASTLFGYHGAAMSNEWALSAMFARLMGCFDLDEEGLRRRVEKFLMSFGNPDFFEADRELLFELLRPVVLRDRQASNRSQIELSLIADRLLSYVVGLGPIVMVLDEVQWGKESLAYVRHLQTFESELAVVVILTVNDAVLRERSDEAFLMERILEGEQGAVELELAPMSDQEMGELLDELLVLAPRLRREIVEKAQGSPLLARQLFSWLTEEMHLEPGDRGYELARPCEIPGTFSDLWTARIQQVIRDQPQVEWSLLRAACLGREFFPADTDGLVHQLWERGLLIRRNERHYFSHESLRSTLLSRLELHPCRLDILGESAEILGEEFRTTGDVQHLERQGRVLEMAGRFDEAFWCFEQVLRRYRRTSHVHRPKALLKRMEEIKQPYQLGQPQPPTVCQWSMEVHRSWLGGEVEMRDAMFLAVRRLEEIEARMGIPPSKEQRSIRAFLCSIQGEFEQAVELFEELLAQSEGAEKFRLLERVSWVWSQMGEMEKALEVARQAEELAAVKGITGVDRGALYLRLARLNYLVEQYNEALQYLDKARTAFGPGSSPTGMAEISNLEGDILRSVGDLEEAQAAYLRASHYAELAGLENCLVEKINVIIIQILLGKKEEVLAQDLEGMWQTSLEHSAVIFQPYLRLIQSWAAAARGDREKFADYWSEAMDRFGPMVEPDGLAVARGLVEELNERRWEGAAKIVEMWIAERQKNRSGGDSG